MELAPEDSLRLNVMLANRPQAIRIDESRMILYALSDKGEMEIPLNPTGRDEPYLKQIREMLSMHALGTPSGYPRHVWSRMGHLSSDNLEALLLLGEPEAVVAIAYSEELTDDLARKAWWALEDAENARQMLRTAEVVNGEMGPVLAAYLVEFLPFETEAEKIMDTVQLVLQPGLLGQGIKEDLWKRARRKNAFYVGFLTALPDDLPEQGVSAPAWERLQDELQAMIHRGNPLAEQLYRVLSPSGQAWLATLDKVLEKPGTQDVVNRVLDAAADYFSTVRPEGRADATIEDLEKEAETWVSDKGNALVQQILDLDAGLAPELAAMRVLAGSGYGMVRPVFGRSDAIGTLMRRKLQPILEPYRNHINRLRQVP
ncbi:hypothetical protein [Thiolapillus brandeum]|uniref:Sulfur reduction protein DsrS n=1 Tax=Thiolapillus brandeum TaxID=1076588 RepID=A0A7U6GKP3_9GAMM|nr:hypothetical protein [Thiolapillus brandeum]BAO45357.1 conserved hypothetical protein [Thiolapillus brandeum]